MSPPRERQDYDHELSAGYVDADEEDEGFTKYSNYSGITQPKIIHVDQYGQPIKGASTSDDYWAGRAPLRPVSPPKFLDEPPQEPVKKLRESRGDYTPERKQTNYHEILPGVRSSPWRDDPQKKKARERKEKEILEAAEKLRLQQEEIFFRKRKADKENLSRQGIESNNFATVSKTKPSRYPNPEDMYKQLREFQEMANTKRGSSRKKSRTPAGRSRSRPRNTAIN